MKNLFIYEKMDENNPKWENAISRINDIHSSSENDIRSEFNKDYTRIIHSNAYKRLKHKTQVFFSPENDHICTRSEHITHVESISYTISSYLGLNTELTKSIATAHDLGHSPFGHEGEKILSSIYEKEFGCKFWHEKNGLYFVDNIEILEGHDGYQKNLNLTYAIRDGIISHCGEIDENSLKPRNEFIDLNDYTFPNQFAPYTWEGCIVKIADKISYIGRDIEDAISLHIIDDDKLNDLYLLLKDYSFSNILNNSNIIKYLVNDLCENSSPEKGLCFSNKAFNLINKIKKFNYENIYYHKKTLSARKFFELIIYSIFDILKNCFDIVNNKTLENIKNLNTFYPKLSNGFYHFLENYCDFGNRESLRLKNTIVFDYNNKSDFYKSILTYISGMTDNFAIELYNEIIGF